LRPAGGLADYSQSFIERYVVPIVYPEELAREVQVVMGSILIALNILIYAYWMWRRRNRVSK